MLLSAFSALLAGMRPAPVSADTGSANGLTVTKTVLEDPLIGGAVAYRITVTNNSFNNNKKAYNLDIVDDLPDNVSYVSTTAPVAPMITNKTATQQRLHFRNLTDLAVGQTFSIDITATLAQQLPRQGIITPNAMLDNRVEAFVSSDPRVTLPSPVPTSVNDPLFSAGVATESARALPFKLTKVTSQTTDVNQATGGCPGTTGEGRGFGYTLTATNNPLGGTTGATIEEILPYGVTYCGTPSGQLVPTVTPQPDGTTTLVYSLGDLAPNQVVVVTPQVAIPYTYPGTTTHIPDGQGFINQARLSGTYPQVGGTLYRTDWHESPVTAKYATIDKSDLQAIVKYDDTIIYTLRPQISTNYNISTLYLVDTVPNGQQYVPGSSSHLLSDGAASDGHYIPCANAVHAGGSGIYYCPDSGTTVLTWGPFTDSPTTPLLAGGEFSVTFRTQVCTTYLVGSCIESSVTPIVAGDSFRNHVTMFYDNATNIGDHSANPHIFSGSDQDSEGQTTSRPTLTKTIVAVTRGDGSPSNGTVAVDGKTATAAVGDIVTFRLEYSGVFKEDQQDIVISDFLPTNYRYLAGTSSYGGAYAANGRGINGTALSVGLGPDPLCTGSCNSNGTELVYALTGIGGSAPYITPQSEGLTIQLQAQVMGGTIGTGNTNLGKFSGSASASSGGAAYSGRDQVVVTTIGPNLTITKTNIASSAALGNEPVTYTLVIRNTGGSTAYQVANLVDDLPDDITYVSTTSISPSVAASFVSYSGGFGGVLTYQFDQPIAPGAAITIVYQAQIDPAPAVGSTQTNTATIASYKSQPTGVSTTGSYGSTTGSSDVHIGGDVLQKTATILQPQVNGLGGRVTIGDWVKYTITYSIPNNATVYKGQIRDCMPLGFHYVGDTYVGSVTSGALPDPSAFATNDDNATTFIVRNGTDNCPASQEEIVIQVGTQVNTTSAVTLQAQLTARITGRNQGGTQVFTTFPGANNKRANGTTDNANTAFIYASSTAAGSPVQVFTRTVANNGTDNNVYIPHLTPHKTLVTPTGPNSVPTPSYVLVPQGNQVLYRLDLDNDGGSTAYDIAPLVDTLATGLTFNNVYPWSGACNTIAPPVSATVIGQLVTIAAPASLAQGTTYSVCLVATMGAANPPSTLYDNTLTVGTGSGDKYYSAPSGLGSPLGLPGGVVRAIGTDRAPYTQNTVRTVTVRTPDVLAFPALPDQTYGAAPISLVPNTQYAATSTGNRPIDYTVVSGPCTIVGSSPNFQVRIDGAGTCVVKASQRDENLAPDVTQSFNITKAPLTVKVNDITRPFGAPNPPCTLATNYPQTFVNGDDVADLGGALACTTPATPNSNPGNYPLTPGGYTSPNYNITYLPAKLIVTICNVQLDLILPPGATTQYSDQAIFRAQVRACGILPTGPVQFTINNTIIGSAALDSNGVAQLPIQVLQNVGAHNVTARYTSTDIRFSSAIAGPSPLTVTTENATADYSGKYSFAVNNATKKATVQLSATIKDITAVSGNPDTYPGDVRTAKVNFVDANTGAPLNAACTNVTVALISFSDTKVGTASCSFQSTSTTLRVRIVVVGNYTGSFTLPNPIIVGTGSGGATIPGVTTNELLVVRRDEA